MEVIKRNGKIVEFDIEKIKKAINGAIDETHYNADIDRVVEYIEGTIDDTKETITVEEIQDIAEEALMYMGYYAVAKAFILYRSKHTESRFIKERMDYMKQYSNNGQNASTSSETDDNANVVSKNVSNLEGEVYKTNNRIIQRQWMKEKLEEMFPEVKDQYVADLNHHIIYTNDESSSPTIKPYCMAASLYPLMTEGVGNIDKVTPDVPKHLHSFSGQLVNLAFLLSSQCKGAVAFGEYFVALNYYIIQDFGPSWVDKLDMITTSVAWANKKTVKDEIEESFDQFVWGINQPAGNRGYQSPFINISYYDHTYFDSLFGNFYYPDGTKPSWEDISTLQKMFMKWFNKVRLKQVLTFPVETMAMVYDKNTNDIIDKEWKEFTAEMYAEGASFFTYISDSADSLASCCRLKNEIQENTFNPTSGLTGVMTGSCNVITLNINRIVQDWFNQYDDNYLRATGIHLDRFNVHIKDSNFITYLEDILSRVYKYHIAFKTMLYDLEEKGMFASSNGGYIYMNKLYSTVGINGLNEAAQFLGLEVGNNKDYIDFLQLILGTIKEQNKIHSIHDKKRPFLFNSECVPAESLGVKNYNWDSKDGYFVPKNENLYNSYFYDAHDPNTSVLDKFILHGRQTYQYTDGGSALHCNLQDHLSKYQYLKLIDFAIQEGTSYFTFNIPNTKCLDCGHIVKKPFDVCPKCGSTHVEQYTRIIGYLRPISAFSQARQEEAKNRVYSEPYIN